MQLSWAAKGAQAAERSRNRIARTGYTPKGAKVWTDAEIATLRLLRPSMTYLELEKHLKGRSWEAIRGKAKGLGLTVSRHVWTGAEIVKLRRLYQNGTTAEIRAAFPHFSFAHIIRIANQHGLRRPRRPYKITGIQAIDQIRARAFELGYTMPDIDLMARSKRYFQSCSWHRHIHHKAIARAIQALDGAVAAKWN